MTPETPPQAEAHARRHVGFSWIWLLPLATVLLVGYLVIKLVAERGPMISISFESAGGLSSVETGLETLVSGAYVAVDPGPKGGQRKTEFKGLEKPPSVRSDEPGSAY